MVVPRHGWDWLQKLHGGGHCRDGREGGTIAGALDASSGSKMSPSIAEGYIYVRNRNFVEQRGVWRLALVLVIERAIQSCNKSFAELGLLVSSRGLAARPVLLIIVNAVRTPSYSPPTTGVAGMCVTTRPYTLSLEAMLTSRFFGSSRLLLFSAAALNWLYWRASFSRSAGSRTRSTGLSWARLRQRLLLCLAHWSWSC
ncbi:hypothetical protein GY45DRAFT_1316444 [Cubamyces sp. BRFM 1775]|nr:hypothetical protein GY45DRAFT_1316444 [Cubamyces sp. BRFM 1775]